jgi:hypothetical protein
MKTPLRGFHANNLGVAHTYTGYKDFIGPSSILATTMRKNLIKPTMGEK